LKPSLALLCKTSLTEEQPWHRPGLEIGPRRGHESGSRLAKAPLPMAKLMKARKIRRNSGHSGESRRHASDGAQFSVLDVAHLDAQVCSDAQLRDELLRLYAESLVGLAPVLDGTAGRARQEAAHKLKGASLAIGAFALARLCEVLEKEAGPGLDQELPGRGETRPTPLRGERLRRDVAQAIEATRRRVAELLGSGRG
jgi:HPt (histidine-containing phosphotransfer) domain-containing protein